MNHFIVTCNFRFHAYKKYTKLLRQTLFHISILKSPFSFQVKPRYQATRVTGTKYREFLSYIYSAGLRQVPRYPIFSFPNTVCHEIARWLNHFSVTLHSQQSPNEDAQTPSSTKGSSRKADPP